jgi:hypothetical protein
VLSAAPAFGNDTRRPYGRQLTTSAPLALGVSWSSAEEFVPSASTAIPAPGAGTFARAVVPWFVQRTTAPFAGLEIVVVVGAVTS